MSPTSTLHWDRMAALHSLRALVREGIVTLRPARAHWCFTHHRLCWRCELIGAGVLVDVDLV
jgi:hypothetical protein